MNNKAFKGLFLGFGSALAVLIPGIGVARANGTMINHALNIDTSKVVNVGEVDPESANYFKSDYASLAEVKAAGESLVEEVEANGLVLLKNDNSALPLKMSEPKVSLFGSGSAAFNYTPSLSGGSVNTSAYKNMKQALESVGCKVNATLWDYYKSNPTGGRQNRVEGIAKTYTINEVPWADVSAAASPSFVDYGDAAIVVFTRDSGEGFDVSTKGSDGRNGMYLGLSDEEMDLLRGLTTLKQSNIFSRIIVLLNSSCPIELNFLDNDSVDVDSIMWIGNAGGFGLEAVSKALVGNINPSGKLSDTYVKDAISSPAMASWIENEYGIFAQEYPNASTYGLNSTQKYYGVYVEGIYVGYRYYETRYEDVVTSRAKVGSFNYDNVVAYPFGHGLSYTSYEYSDFSVTENSDGTYTVTVTVTNNGSEPGREVVQVYGQKPYTDGGLEKASVELMGFYKTDVIAAGGSENVSIVVSKEQFKSYDNLVNKTYILDNGKHYLSVGHDAHDALNNILSLKGNSVGDASFAKMVLDQDGIDATTYSISSETGYTITNQLDSMDINMYENRGDNSVTYLSRNDWAGTWPTSKVVLNINDAMALDLASHRDIVEREGLEEITYASGEQNALITLRGLDFDHKLWDSLLDQMTYEEQSLLLTNGAFGTSPIDSISLKETKASDGPNFITDTSTNVSFPSEGIWASTFDQKILERIGDYLAEDARINGLDTLYAPGINIHRTPFIARSHEYFSEDPYLTGISVMNEIKGMEAKGVVAATKHFAFNDEDSQRNGIGVWLNEQSAREIYLAPFEYALGKNYGNGHACMSGFNRGGTYWVGASDALQNVIARSEWGFEGYFITDMASSNGALYMTFDDGIVAGTDIFLGSGSKTSLKEYKKSLTFKHIVREAVHRVLYVQVNCSCAMNGVTSNSKVITITPWWDTLLSSLIVASSVLAGLSFAMIPVASLIKGKKD